MGTYMFMKVLHSLQIVVATTIVVVDVVVIVATAFAAINTIYIQNVYTEQQKMNIKKRREKNRVNRHGLATE